MSIVHDADRVTVHHGDCLDVLRELPVDSVDAIVTDPPYGLGFMGKAWDELPPGKEWAAECLRVLKPGGHLLAFGGTRTWHRLACAVEDAGFEVRDSIAWMYGSGFPKSLNVAAAIERLQDDRLQDEHLQDERRFTAWMRTTGVTSRQIDEATDTCMGGHYLTAASQPAIPTAALLDRMRPILPEVPDWVEQIVAEREAAKAEARVRNANGRFLQALELDNAPAEITHELAEQWQGWGTALKPAFEPVVVARKPLSGTVAANVLAHGTGALNVDACRIGDSGGRRDSGLDSRSPASVSAYGDGLNGRTSELVPGLGRWPANVVLDESQADELDRQAPDAGGSGVASGPSLRDATAASTAFGARGGFEGDPAFYGDTGGASRFFYVPKADSSERPRVDGIAHPTVKPIDLMRWLVRLVTPPGGTVLEPFAGSGTTVEACLLEGFRVIAIERDETYVPLVLSRVERVRTIGTGLRPDDYGEALKALGKERDPDEGSLFDELGMVADA